MSGPNRVGQRKSDYGLTGQGSSYGCGRTGRTRQRRGRIQAKKGQVRAEPETA